MFKQLRETIKFEIANLCARHRNRFGTKRFSTLWLLPKISLCHFFLIICKNAFPTYNLKKEKVELVKSRVLDSTLKF